jgi:hypothetical protein
MVQTTNTRRTMAAKKSAAIASIAVRLAKEADDIMYTKLGKYKKLHIAMKQAIFKKYKTRATSQWHEHQSQN